MKPETLFTARFENDTHYVSAGRADAKSAALNLWNLHGHRYPPGVEARIVVTNTESDTRTLYIAIRGEGLREVSSC